MFAVALVLLGLLSRCENIWQLLLGLASLLPVAWIAGALIFSQQTTSCDVNPNVKVSGERSESAGLTG